MPSISAEPIAICAARLTPLGAFMGALSGTPTTQLGATAMRAALADATLAPDKISEVLVGCVLPAGLGQVPARQAARSAGLPDSVGATTINKVSESGMKAVMLGHDLIRSGSAEIVLAGGMESMSNAPFLMTVMHKGHKVGSSEIIDHMMKDGLEDAYERDQPMGSFGEATTERCHFNRDDQDTYATETVIRAHAAVTNGDFDAECVPTTAKTRKGDVLVAHDERPVQVDPAKIPLLRSAFGEGGTITAASASANADGAAAMILTAESTVQKEKMPVTARILGHATYSQEPAWFTTAPFPQSASFSIRSPGARTMWIYLKSTKPLQFLPWQRSARAAVHAKTQCEWWRLRAGDPIGATGARILVTLVHALKTRGLEPFDASTIGKRPPIKNNKESPTMTTSNRRGLVTAQLLEAPNNSAFFTGSLSHAITFQWLRQNARYKAKMFCDRHLPRAPGALSCG